MSWARVSNALGGGQEYLGAQRIVTVAANGRLDVVTRTYRNQIENWTHDDRAQEVWVRNIRSGILISDPSLVHTAGDSRMFLFGVGTTGNLFWNVFSNRWLTGMVGDPWSETGWNPVERDADGSTVLLSSNPQAVWTGDNKIDVFCTRRTADLADLATAVRYTFDVTSLTGTWDRNFTLEWDGRTPARERFNHGATIRPLVLSLRPNLRLALLARRPDDHLWIRHFSIGWGEWLPYDELAVLSSDPVPVRMGGTIFVFIRSGASLWHTEVSLDQFLRGYPNMWLPLDGELTSPHMSVSSDFRDGFDIYVRGVEKAVWVNHFNTSSLSGNWESLGAEINGDSDPSAIFFSGSQQVFAMGLDDNLWINGTLAPY